MLKIRSCVIAFISFLCLELSAQTTDVHENRSAEIIPNLGQYHPAARYKIPIPYGSLYLNSDGFTYDLSNKEDLNAIQEYRHENPAQGTGELQLRKHAVKVSFLNMKYSPKFIEENHKPYHYNFFVGQNPESWASKVKPAEKVIYKNVYPNVDLEVDAHDGVKFQWVLKHASLQTIANIQSKIEGADSLAIYNNKLIIYTSVGVLIEDEPYAYQLFNGQQYPVACSYHINGNILSYTIESELIEGAELIIDPKLIFSTYSGSVGDNFGYTATYDSRGNLYAGGIVDQQGPYPVTTGAYDTTWNGGQGLSPVNLPCDISISKYDSAGTQLLWATYLGGTRDEYPHSLVVDRNDNLIVYGTSYSNNFPYTKDAYDSTHGGGTDIIVSKLSADGSQLLASTYIGGSSNDGLVLASSPLLHNYADNFRGDVIPDDDNHVFVSSSTNSNNMPLVNQTKSIIGGVQDGFLFELNEDFTQLLWATYFGGDGLDAAYSIKLDINNNICIGGGTTSDNFETADTVYQNRNAGSVDGYIAVFNKFNKSIKALTYYGTSAYDQIYFIDIDNKGFIYATGQTEGSISKTAGTYGSDNKGQFIFKIDTSLVNLEWETTFGNTDNKINLAPSAFLVDVCEHIYFSGWGSNIYNGVPHPGSTNGMEITSDGEQQETDNKDFYILVLDKNASGILYGTYFGGDSTADHVDGGTSRFDKRGVIYQSVCSSCPGFGSTSKLNSEINDFPVSPNAAFTYNSSVRCSNASFKIDLQIKTAVVADFIASPTIGCLPLNVQFTNRSVLGQEWLWDFGDNTTSDLVDPEHTYTEAGLYEVTLTVIDSNTCNISDVYKRTILVIDQGTAAFDVEYNACTDLLKIDNNSIGALNYYWDFGDGNTSTEKNPTHSYQNNGDYTIRLVINEESFCADSTKTTISINRVGDQNFTLYNVFTPNDDQINDCFRFDGLENFCEGIEWKVYNRWGELVFETTDPYECWNGKLPNSLEPLPESVYFYILDLFPGNLSSQDVISGTITLIR